MSHNDDDIKKIDEQIQNIMDNTLENSHNLNDDGHVIYIDRINEKYNEETTIRLDKIEDISKKNTRDNESTIQMTNLFVEKESEQLCKDNVGKKVRKKNKNNGVVFLIIFLFIIFLIYFLFLFIK